MKWLGQYIQDLTARFRDDVYLENISSGTIASGGNLGLDSNNKIVKQSDTGITDLHGAGVDGSANSLLTDDGDGTITSEAKLTWDGDDLNIASSTSTKPRIQLTSTTNDARGSILSFISDKGGAGADNDVLGTLQFWGDNTAQEQTQFAAIQGVVSEADDTDEAGKLDFKVTASGGTTSQLTTGLSLEGEHATSGEVDVTIGAEATSTTTIAGTLTMGSTATLNNDGEIQVGEQPGINTLANLTSMGNANNLIMSYSDIQWYNAVNDGSPQLSIGSSATERFIIQPFYDSGAQTLDYVKFNTIEASSTANKGQYIFQVDSVSRAAINDDGLYVYAGGGLTLIGDTDDSCVMSSTTNGATTITTNDASGTNAHFEIEANGNITLDAAGDIALEAAGHDMTFDGQHFVWTNSTSQKPEFKIIDSTNDTDGSRFIFEKNRGAVGVANDLITAIQFKGYNAAGTPELTNYAQILPKITDATDGQESGSLTFQVASHGGGNETGLVIKGGSQDDEVDVDIALGTASVTTVAGTLTMGSTAALTNAGLVAVANQSNITGLGTISSGVWNGTAVATGYTKHLMHYRFMGYSTGDGTNYEMGMQMTDGQAPWEHADPSSSDGLTIPGASGTNVSEMIRMGGHVMPNAATLKKWTGWVSYNDNGNDCYIALFKWSPVENDNTDISASHGGLTLLDEATIAGKANDKVMPLSETSFTSASVAAGDIIFTQVKTSTNGKIIYFNTTLEVEF